MELIKYAICRCTPLLENLLLLLIHSNPTWESEPLLDGTKNVRNCPDKQKQPFINSDSFLQKRTALVVINRQTPLLSPILRKENAAIFLICATF